MAKSTSLRKSDASPIPDAAVKPIPAAPRESLVERLTRARTANEMTSIIGLKPIKGRSGPKIAY